MDQFASALSKRDHALLIDCRTLAYEHVPLRLAEHGLAVVIANSAVRRELVTSAYNERRRECEEAVVAAARPARPAGAALAARCAADEIASSRDPARTMPCCGGHGTSSAEIERVAEAVEALERDDFARARRADGGVARSLRDDYEVSSEQLDLLVGLASAQDYVLGARLTGAGFGGCTVNLVQADRIEDFARDVIAPYRERTGLAGGDVRHGSLRRAADVAPLSGPRARSSRRPWARRGPSRTRSRRGGGSRASCRGR